MGRTRDYEVDTSKRFKTITEMRREKEAPMVICQKCGYTWRYNDDICPSCGNNDKIEI